MEEQSGIKPIVKLKYRSKKVRRLEEYATLVTMIANKEKLLRDIQGQKDNAKKIIEMLFLNINFQYGKERAEAMYKSNAALYNLIKMFKMEKDLLFDLGNLYKKRDLFKL